MRLLISIWSILILPSSLSIKKTSDIVQESGDLVTRTQTSIDLMPEEWQNLEEGTTYTDPTSQQVTDFISDVFTPLYNSSFETAATNALNFGYRLVQFQDNTVAKTYYILERDPASVANNYWGTYTFNPVPVKGQLIIQSPHPSFDTFTGKQGAYVFRQIGAAFFFMSGAHRCNSPIISGCDGTSNVCNNNISGVAPPADFLNDPGEFRKADVAHNGASMFQALTEWVYDDNPSHYYFVQLHGFGQNLTPHAILSNGRDEYTTPPMTDHLATLRTQLGIWWDQLSGSQESLIIEVAHDDPDHNFNSLLATTNTQGRHINGSNNPCETAANQNNGHFIHMEMAKKNGDYYLREEANFQIVGKALESTFLDAPLPVTLISFTVDFINSKPLLKWKTATETNNSHFEIERAGSSLLDFETVGYVSGHNNSESIKSYHWVDQTKNLPIRNLYYRLKQVDFGGTHSYSEVLLLKRLLSTPGAQKMLLNNYGSGKSTNMNLPFNVPKDKQVSLTITNPNSGRILEKKVFEHEIDNFLQTTLSNSKPGIYLITVQFDGMLARDKFLRF